MFVTKDRIVKRDALFSMTNLYLNIMSRYLYFISNNSFNHKPTRHIHWIKLYVSFIISFNILWQVKTENGFELKKCV